MHAHRRFCIGAVSSAEELARMLTERTWCLCSGFCVLGHERYLFLNDATCEDGAGEFAVVLGGIGADRHVQIESVTMSWCSFVEALTHIQHALAGDWDANDFARAVTLLLETPEQHQRCPLCA
jgi:hypothetical protein